ncbi:DUF397 domain-containing protein [Nocardia gamkensis]|uniref:DUF397 domain-containing protein n=1 Tax=Nocardia gamkensis TaxID=352869 RepID=UPI0036EA6A85
MNRTAAGWQAANSRIRPPRGILHGSFVLLDFGTESKGRPIEPPVVYLDGGMSSDLYIAHLNDGTVGMRDSKNPTGPALTFTPAAWDTFLTATQDGEFTRH